MCRGVSRLGVSSIQQGLLRLRRPVQRPVQWSAGFLLGLGIALGAVSGSATPAQAQYSSGPYNSAQFVDVLRGIGYPIAAGAALNAFEVQSAIAEIQREANLPSTGNLDPATASYTATHMQLLQRQLNQILGLNLPNDQPYYGPRTSQGIADFQRNYNLSVTGIADLSTRRALQEVAGRIAIAPQAPKPPIGGDNPIYTDAELRVILQGLGYEIDLNRPLSDRPAVIALLDFQREYNLNRTGQPDYATQQRVLKVLNQLQDNLRRIVDRNLRVTGQYDAQTATAIRKFQAKENLPINGIAPMDVRQRLNTMARGY